jgi:cytoskeletal protein CcmA (bactofilin family)
MSAVGTNPPERKVANPAVGKAGSVIAPDMTITGNIESEQGAVQVLGKVVGELRVADLVIGPGGKVEGDIFALDLTVEGSIKGTVHANHVNLLDSATVAGDIYHSSLKIDRNALFEGLSRRMQTEMGSVRMDKSKPVETPARAEPAPLRPEGPKIESAPRPEMPRPQNGAGGVLNFPGEHSAKV